MGRHGLPHGALAAALLLAGCANDTGGSQPKVLYASLVQSAGQASTADCPTGGVVLEQGVDANGDGTLSASEVQNTYSVCNGEPGPQGLQGPPGPQGIPGPPGVAPSGAVLFFNLATCPDGWSPLTDAEGRALVGMPNGGTLAQPVGAALGDLAHLSISETPAHAHPIAQQAGTTDIRGSHTHPYTQFASFGDWTDSGTGRGWANGIVAPAGDHAHIVTVPAHATDANVGPATVDVTMPYLQLLVCEKD